MKKKYEDKMLTALQQKQISELQMQYSDELNSDPKYSLAVDPTNKYNMSDIQKRFIQLYIDFKNIDLAASICKIDSDTALDFFSAYSTQQEIRRINLALFHRQFQAKLLTIDEIGGFLSSLLTGENIPLAEQLKPMEKVKVAEDIVKLNMIKAEAMNKPQSIMYTDITEEIKSLSISTIKQLLSQANEVYQIPEKTEQTQQLIGNNLENAVKEKMPHKISDVNIDVLSPEEQAYIESLSSSELLKFLESINKEEKK